MAISPRFATSIRSKPLIDPPVRPTAGCGRSTRMSYSVEDGGAPLAHAHLAQHGLRRLDEAGHGVGTEGADAADAEAFLPRELAGIDHEAAFREQVVERLEIPGGIGRRAEGHDDRRLHGIASSVSKPRPRMPSTRVRQFSQ